MHKAVYNHWTELLDSFSASLDSQPLNSKLEPGKLYRPPAVGAWQFN